MKKINPWRKQRDVSLYRVDVLVPVYNHEDSLETCLRSIFSQDHENIRVTVIDDSSTDSSLQIVRRFEEEFPERLTWKKTASNTGSGRRAREECEFRPVGDFWAILEGDDWWTSPSKISEQIALLERGAHLVGCSGTTIQCDAKGTEIAVIKPLRESWSYLDWVCRERSVFVHFSSILWKNVFTGKENFLPHILKKDWPVDDWGITLGCLAESGMSLGHLDKTVSRYNFTGRGAWSSLHPEEQRRKNDELTYQLRKLVPLRYKIARWIRFVNQKIQSN